MHYNLDLNDRPFKAIKAGTKKVEIRVPNVHDNIPYKELKAADTITFTDNATKELMEVEIFGIRHYNNVKTLLETEGTKNTLSSGLSIDEVVEKYKAIPKYEENTSKYGAYAIEVKKIT